MGKQDHSFNEILSYRVRKRWFIYIAMSAFYCLDIYVTLLVLRSGYIEESNPVSRSFIASSSPEWWVVFRIVLLFMTTAALLATFVLATMTLRHTGRGSEIDKVEEVVLGSVTLFYAFTLVHNLMSIMAPMPQWT